ncbi:TetR/AcrR family transcriptional regulator (plasmid) [Streptomyces sp. NBC_01340]|uniref:TetR/AcrR family transcriptional regulator n=1 Tax=unclassified Streptomyces TaxID=2593676 RepID=UPI002258B862|nr:MULTISPECIES: TetR/AcrR family transcriptional regulator [unclassified Streptomyces]MCX4460747.1 TetR/AcrR family transcriptional regulator [Streptomyces sp. NBC_01719]MCX4499923.1 TetR/AcrR family transcriptional regulator [Streptomyces sp. NBC_01728]WSI45049.1 TetR/AcrR family transcriptional regulator [Streptomyces sp. NBC_01340]
MSKPRDVSAPVRRSEARERLLSTASRLFYSEGIRGVGVDRVMAEADVARGTFYRHFDGKDDLVRAYLEATDQQIRDHITAAEKEISSPADFLAAVAHGIGEELCGQGFRGCPFINAAAEYPDPSSVIHQAVLRHRVWFREVLRSAFRRLGSASPEQSANSMVALRDGAMVAGYLGDAQAARAVLVHGVTVLVAAR